MIARLEAADVVVRKDAVVRLPDHRVQLDEAQEGQASELLEAVDAGGLAPPDAKQLSAALGLPPPKTLELLHMLEKQNRVVRVTPDIFYARKAYDEAKRLLHSGIQTSDSDEITVADYRTALSASRKYALALLEHFDQTGVTIRLGDTRKLRAT